MAPDNIKEQIMSHNTPSLAALKRFEQVVQIVSDDEIALSLLEKLLDKAEGYFCKVFEMETRLKLARFRMESDEFRSFATNLDQNRRLGHEALMADLHIFNRYVLKEFKEIMPIGGIYSKDPETIRDRVAVGDWAGELLSAIYQNRPR